MIIEQGSSRIRRTIIRDMHRHMFGVKELRESRSEEVYLGLHESQVPAHPVVRNQIVEASDDCFGMYRRLVSYIKLETKMRMNQCDYVAKIETY